MCVCACDSVAAFVLVCVFVCKVKRDVELGHKYYEESYRKLILWGFHFFFHERTHKFRI